MSQEISEQLRWEAIAVILEEFDRFPNKGPFGATHIRKDYIAEAIEILRKAVEERANAIGNIT